MISVFVCARKAAPAHYHNISAPKHAEKACMPRQRSLAQLTNFQPWAVYTPAMDDYVKELIQGITAPDKPLKDLKDNILDLSGPLCKIFENLLAFGLDNMGQDSVIG